jgi:hypothetical protein
MVGNIFVVFFRYYVFTCLDQVVNTQLKASEEMSSKEVHTQKKVTCSASLL